MSDNMNDKKCPYSATPLTMSNGAPVVDNEIAKPLVNAVLYSQRIYGLTKSSLI